MKNVAPQVDTNEQVSVAEEQEEYKTVVALPVEFPTVAAPADHPEYEEIPGRKNSLLLAYKPNPEELAKLVRGEYLYLHMLTFGGKLQPHILTVGTDELESWYGLKVSKASPLCLRRRLGATGEVMVCQGPKGHDEPCNTHPFEIQPKDLWKDAGGR